MNLAQKAATSMHYLGAGPKSESKPRTRGRQQRNGRMYFGLLLCFSYWPIVSKKLVASDGSSDKTFPTEEKYSDDGQQPLRRVQNEKILMYSIDRAPPRLFLSFFDCCRVLSTFASGTGRRLVSGTGKGTVGRQLDHTAVS